MAAKGYCTTEDVENFLTRTFSAAQTTQCAAIIESVEAYIDGETKRGWLEGAQTNEAHYIESKNIYLKYFPVASVASITGRFQLGDSETTLVVDVDYEVIDLDNGHIRLLYPASYDRILVSYTPVATLPVDLKQAAIETAAQWLAPTLQPGSFGLDSFSLPDMAVKYSRAHVQTAAPPNALRTIERYSLKVLK